MKAERELPKAWRKPGKEKERKILSFSFAKRVISMGYRDPLGWEWFSTMRCAANKHIERVISWGENGIGR
jgi:hypothetical protein